VTDPAAAPLPRISVITPSLNQGEFIRATIDSVLAQQYPDLELWVIDGGSTDGTVEILKDYSGRLSWISERDAGQADALNKGLARATGEVVGWLNSDDTYLPGALAAVGDFFRRHPDEDGLYGDALYVDRGGAAVRPYPTRDFDWETLAEECFLCQPAVFFRRRLVERLGGLDPELGVVLDYDLWIRLFRERAPARLRLPLATSRMYSDNKTLAMRPRAYREIFRVVSRHYGHVPYRWALGRASYAWHRNDQYHDPRRTTAPVFILALLTMAWYNRRNPRYLWSWLTSRNAGFASELSREERARRAAR
jgi:glycosyltransferase involved in cell wall biosynthesis